MVDYDAIKRNLNRTFGVVGADGRIWIESHNLERCREVQTELARDGYQTKVIGRTYS